MTLFRKMLVGLAFVSAGAFAHESETLIRLAMQNAALQPEQVMAQTLEKYPGFIEEFSIDEEDDRMVYELSVINPETGRRTELEIDIVSGKTLETEEEKIRSWNAADKTFSGIKYQQLVNGQVTLQTAVEEAKKLTPGLLIEAELEEEKGIVFFEIELLAENSWKTVVVDIKTGKLIPVARGSHGQGGEHGRHNKRERHADRDHDGWFHWFK